MRQCALMPLPILMASLLVAGCGFKSPEDKPAPSEPIPSEPAPSASPSANEVRPSPKWRYVCDEQDHLVKQAECRPQIRGEDLQIALTRDEDAWKLVVAQDGGLGHLFAELTVDSPEGDITQLMAHREDKTCFFNHCEFDLSDETIDAIVDAGQFEVSLTRIRIVPHSVRRVETSETFSARGLREALREAEH